MSQVSKKAINKNVQDKLINNLFDMFADITKVSEVKTFIEDFFSPTEKIMFAKRMAIAILLSEGYSTREISAFLNVSTATVISVSKFLTKYKGYKLIIDRYRIKHTNIDFFSEIEKIINKVPSQAKKGKSGRLRVGQI